MNTFEAAVVARLKAAGLLAVAERAAKRVDLRLADCISPGEVTGGHRALWTALAKEKRTAAQIAAIVAFPIEAITRELRGEVPPPAADRCSRVSHPPAADVATLIEAAIAPLRRRIVDLEAIVSRSRPARGAQAYLDQRGDAGDAVRTIAAKHGVHVAHLLTSRKTAACLLAKAEIVRVLTRRFRMSQREIADVLGGMDHKSIGAIQGRTHVTPSGARKAAA